MICCKICSSSCSRKWWRHNSVFGKKKTPSSAKISPFGTIFHETCHKSCHNVLYYIKCFHKIQSCHTSYSCHNPSNKIQSCHEYSHTIFSVMSLFIPFLLGISPTIPFGPAMSLAKPFCPSHRSFYTILSCHESCRTVISCHNSCHNVQPLSSFHKSHVHWVSDSAILRMHNISKKAVSYKSYRFSDTYE